MAIEAGRAGEQVWLIAASSGGAGDQTQRFLAEGVWENGHKDKYLDLVKSIRTGDRIALKTTATRKGDLPFDGRGFLVSTMTIKAIGTVKRNHGDGRRIDVDWTPVKRDDWYFYTFVGPVWRVLPGSWEADALLAFTFEGRPQDVDRFRNAPFWRERWGDADGKDRRFAWTPFYEAMADALATYRDRRPELVAMLRDLNQRGDGLGYLTDHYADGSSGFIRDVDPFTFFGVFNRGITLGRRRQLAHALADALGVKEPVPEVFDGIPVLENRKSWFFSFEKDREPGAIDALWEVFAAARQFGDTGDAEAQSRLIAAYDDAAGRPQVGWNLSFALYWIRPWNFLTLDGKSREFLQSKLEITVPLRGPKGRCSGEDYVGLRELLSSRFAEQAFPVHSFPEAALEAWLYRSPEPVAPPAEVGPQAPASKVAEHEPEEPVPDQRPPLVPYSLENVLADGCFLSRDTLDRMLRTLRGKKNLVLQGPPGTGKTWLARRLGFALIGEKDESRLRAVQFHPTLSYEDFVRGLRPNADGKLDVVDGVFLRAVETAKATPTIPFVVVIEEINRGNPAQILGEMLTLLEADKRTPDQAVELMHAKDGKRVHIPPNLHVIGTMNIADRSLALIDLALRRRFAFVELEPQLGEAWRRWVTQRCRVAEALADEVQRRIQALNERIAADTSLGRQFRVGHSFVTPPTNPPAAITAEWFKLVVETEIGPLLEEYWYDQPRKAAEANAALLKGL